MLLVVSTAAERVRTEATLALFMGEAAMEGMRLRRPPPVLLVGIAGPAAPPELRGLVGAVLDSESSRLTLG